ncbi:MAG: GNAT family N-acetyltransferase [Thermomicrobiales bacterium]
MSESPANTPRPTLAGDRIILRPTEEADFVHGYRWELDKEVQYWAQGDHAPPDLTFAQYKAQFAPPIGRPGEQDHFTIIARPDAVIGFIGYFHADRRVGKVEVGIGIGEKAYWGKGYGREAMHLLLAHLFDGLGYRRVELDTWSGNERAIRAYRACGFQIEGRLRGSELIDGAYYDTILMGLLRTEWEALHAPPNVAR